MTSARDLISSTQLTKLDQFHTSSGFLQKCNFLKRWEIKVSSRDVHVTFSVHADYSPFH